VIWLWHVNWFMYKCILIVIFLILMHLVTRVNFDFCYYLDTVLFVQC